MAPALIRLLGPDDLDLLCATPEGVFDHPVDRYQAAAFLADAMNRIVVALVEGRIVGMATGTFLRHPDQIPQLFINEVGVHEDYRQQGIGKRVVTALLDMASGCKYVWLGTEVDNLPARALYRSLSGKETEGLVIYEWTPPDGAA